MAPSLGEVAPSQPLLPPPSQFSKYAAGWGQARLQVQGDFDKKKSKSAIDILAIWHLFQGYFRRKIRWRHSFYHSSVCFAKKVQVNTCLYHGREGIPINGQDLSKNFEKYITINKNGILPFALKMYWHLASKWRLLHVCTYIIFVFVFMYI